MVVSWIFSLHSPFQLFNQECEKKENEMSKNGSMVLPTVTGHGQTMSSIKRDSTIPARLIHS